jgi:hypothetical protein
MAGSSGRRRRKRERVDEMTTVVRLALVIWELIEALIREHFIGGGPGRIL